MPDLYVKYEIYKHKHIILPIDNKAQWESAKDDVKEKLKVDFVSKFREIYNIVFNSLQ